MQRQHRQVRELIPWYVNASLAEQEMDQVSAHLAGCVDCSRAVDLELALARRMRQDPAQLDRLVAQQEQSLSRLQSRLPPRTQSPQPRRRPALHRPRSILWPAFATALIVAVALGFFAGRQTAQPTYTLMTAGAPADGPVVQVIFRPQTSEQSIRHLLADSHAQLAGSPSAKGVYRIVLPERTDARAYAQRLAQHPDVRWAEAELR